MSIGWKIVRVILLLKIFEMKSFVLVFLGGPSMEKINGIRSRVREFGLTWLAIPQFSFKFISNFHDRVIQCDRKNLLKFILSSEKFSV